MKRRRLLGYAAASAVALVVPWNGLRPVYVHVGHDHIAMIVVRHWTAGERMLSNNLVWPEAKPGDLIVCGTCKEMFVRPSGLNLRAAYA